MKNQKKCENEMKKNKDNKNDNDDDDDDDVEEDPLGRKKVTVNNLSTYHSPFKTFVLDAVEKMTTKFYGALKPVLIDINWNPNFIAFLWLSEVYLGASRHKWPILANLGGHVTNSQVNKLLQSSCSFKIEFFGQTQGELVLGDRTKKKTKQKVDNLLTLHRR